MIVAGIGCRAGCDAATIIGLVERAAWAAGCAPEAMAAPVFKAGEQGLVAAAAWLGLALILVDAEALAAVQSRCLTRSARAAAAAGVGSVAEGAALAAAGLGSRLVLARIAAGGATCALAEGE